MVEQMRERWAHRVIVFRAYHHIPVCPFDLARQCVKCRWSGTSCISEVRFESAAEINVQWIDQRRLNPAMVKLQHQRARDPQAKAGRTRGRAVAGGTKKHQIRRAHAVLQRRVQCK